MRKYSLFRCSFLAETSYGLGPALVGAMVYFGSSSLWAAFDPTVALSRRAQAELGNFYELVEGQKFPNSVEEGQAPRRTRAWGVKEVALRGGGGASGPTSFKELLPYVLASPDQEEAGSCLYMSNTGIAELLNARFHSELSRAPNGPLDVSERYYMNLGEFESYVPGVSDWTTDTILQLNGAKRALKNAFVRYAKGWFYQGKYGPIPAAQGAQGASYGTEVNWFVQPLRLQPKPEDWIQLPKFNRSVLWNSGSLWAVGVMPDDIVERVKRAMREAQSPVQVIYNHEGYWHSVAVVGFDDEGPTGGCPILSEMANNKDTALWWIERYKQFGGCKPKGVFYVRDSIYSDPSEPLYDYDEKSTGEERHLSKRLIVREYDWLLHLANRAALVSATK